MKNRSFLDIKRLSSISINPNTRVQWLVDYVKSISKPIQDISNDNIAYEKIASEYIQYNGQVESLKEFINDNIDPISRRTIIQEKTSIGDYGFYGYFDNNMFNFELDPYKTAMSGYFNGTSWIKEDITIENIIFTGFNNGTSWEKEDISEYNITFLIHNDIYSTLSQYDIDSLTAKLNRYIISPYTFIIKGYETECLFNGIDDFINTGIYLGASTIFNQTIKFIDDQTVIIGNAEYGNSYMIGQGTNGTSYFISVYGNSYHETASVTQQNVKTTLELNGINKKALLDNVLLTGHFYDNTPFTSDLNIKTLSLGKTDTPGGTTFYSYICMGCYYIQDNIITYLTPHPNGYYFDNHGNKYYNKSSDYNDSPLTVELITY